jgi:hypothetical protein
MARKINVAHVRLVNQQLSQTRFKSPAELVRWLGAVQAQDYLGALWAVGMRLSKANDQDVEKALEEKLIVRSWPMRGTLHFVAPEDLRWMLKHLTPKVIARTASVYRKAGLNTKTFSRSAAIWEKALSGKQMIREELYDLLEKNKIDTSQSRGLHILGYLAQQGMICFGPRRGKQHSLVLLDEWLPPAKMLNREEALSELAVRYTISHGPVQVEDFAWWAGLTKTEAKKAIESSRGKITEEQIDGKKYWLSDETTVGPIDPTRAFLIPTYDEMGVGYKDRSSMISRANEKKIANAIFTSAILINGQVAGTWKRTLEKDSVAIEIKPLRKFSTKEKESIQKEATRYAAFVRKDLENLKF